MALTDGDKAECKEIARVIVQEVLLQHTESCPHGKKLLQAKSLLVGIGIGIGAVGASTGIGIFTIIQKLSEITK
jgi:hypothetical protein